MGTHKSNDTPAIYYLFFGMAVLLLLLWHVLFRTTKGKPHGIGKREPSGISALKAPWMKMGLLGKRGPTTGTPGSWKQSSFSVRQRYTRHLAPPPLQLSTLIFLATPPTDFSGFPDVGTDLSWGAADGGFNKTLIPSTGEANEPTNQQPGESPLSAGFKTHGCGYKNAWKLLGYGFSILASC